MDQVKRIMGKVDPDDPISPQRRRLDYARRLCQDMKDLKEMSVSDIERYSGGGHAGKHKAEVHDHAR